MTIYLVKGYLDVAATSLADAQALLGALADPADADNTATIDRVNGKLESLVLVDSERSARSIARNSEAETQIINLVRNRRYEILA